MILKENRKTILNNPALKADLYFTFLKRVRKNFHLVFNFTPSGDNFREKMEKHKQLMTNSQLIWIQNLHKDDLLQIGMKVFYEKMIKEQDKMLQNPEREEQIDAYNL